MAKLNKLEVDRGTNYSITVNYVKNGAAGDITGGEVFFTVKTVQWDDSSSDTSALLKKNVTSFVSPTDGVAVISLVPDDTASVDPGNYWYDIKVRDASGETYKVDEGRFILDGSPTNRTS